MPVCNILLIGDVDVVVVVVGVMANVYVILSWGGFVIHDVLYNKG